MDAKNVPFYILPSKDHSAGGWQRVSLRWRKLRDAAPQVTKQTLGESEETQSQDRGWLAGTVSAAPSSPCEHPAL